MSDPFRIVRQFEEAVAEYTGAKFVVAVNSCTMALLLAVEWSVKKERQRWKDALAARAFDGDYRPVPFFFSPISIPKYTYVSVPQSIIHAGGQPVFRDEDWLGTYQLKPLPVWDSARRFTSGMYIPGQFQCVSFHASKILGDSQGGAILHNNSEADAWLRRARFDGRSEGTVPKDDYFDMVGWHCYMSPDVAARLLWKLSVLPRHNSDLPNSEYPDLSRIEVFQ